MAIDERRHKTRKIINKRIKMSKERFGGGGIEHEQPHRLHKWNLTCSCRMCKNENGDRIFKKKKLDQIQE
jgi:hypothetical protein